MTSRWADQGSFRAPHVAHIVDLVRRWNIDADVLLRGTGIRRDDLADPHSLVSVAALVQVLERARTLTREPAIGLHIGLHTRATVFGHLGFAVLTASTVREAVDLSIQFGPIVTTVLTVRLGIEDGLASLFLDEHADFGSARDIVILATLIGLWQVSRTLTGRELAATLDLAIEPPAYHAGLSIPGVTFRFDQPQHRLCFDAAILDLAHASPDAGALRLAREQCQRELESLRPGGEVTERVRGLLWKSEGGCRSLEETAAVFGQSARTLKRALAAEGGSFLAVRDDERRRLALSLLRSSKLSLTQISNRLGYSDVRNFERRFRFWTASTPSKWRRTGSP